MEYVELQIQRYYQASDQIASDQMGIMKSFKPNTIVVSPLFLLHLLFAWEIKGEGFSIPLNKLLA